MWARNSDVDNPHCASCFGKYHDGNEEWIQTLVTVSSNINEVIKAVLKFLFSLQKDLACTKSTKKH